MRIKTAILSAAALCLGLTASAGFAGGHYKGLGSFGIVLTTASNPVTLVCAGGLRVSATKYRPGFVTFPVDKTKLLCDLWVVKKHRFVKVTDFGFRVFHGEHNRVKVYSAGLPQSDNSKYIYRLSLIRWGSGAQIDFFKYCVKGKHSTYKKVQ